MSKQLLSIYDNPMIYYPISVLMLSGIKDILIISTPADLPNFRNLLGSGSELGLSFHYKEQPNPDGLAHAFILGEEFIGNDDVCLVLGDNIFYGRGFSRLLQESVESTSFSKKATVFGYYVTDPENFGVVELDENNKAISIEEKPKVPKSNYAVVGLYFYPNDVIKISKSIKPSERGELEISSVNEKYLKRGKINVKLMGRGFTWLDTGTFDSLHKASTFVKLLQDSSNYRLGLIDEVAFVNNFINKKQLEKNLLNLSHDFKDYIQRKYL